MDNLIYKRIEDPKSGYTNKIEDRNTNFEGVFTFHPEKVICYIDLLGTADFYDKLAQISDITKIEEKVVTKYLKGFLDIFNRDKCALDYTRFSVHLISDTVLIVPKSTELENKIPCFYDFLAPIVGIYINMMLNHNNFGRFLITRGHYFATFLNDSQGYRALPGGKVLADCAYADKIELKGRGPGIYTTIPELKISKSEAPHWDLLDLSLLKPCFSGKDEQGKSIIDALKLELERIKQDFPQHKNDTVEKEYKGLMDWLELANGE